MTCPAWKARNSLFLGLRSLLGNRVETCDSPQYLFWLCNVECVVDRPAGARSPMGKVEQLIANARSEESLFSWSAAANAYSEALVLEPEPGGKAPILESLGYALYKAAMQTETSLNFKE